MRSAPAWLVAACAAAAALVLASPPARIVAKCLADPISHSTSAGGALLLLSFAALSALACLRNTQAASWPHERRVGAILVASLILGNVANTLGHIAALGVEGLSPTLPAYFWNGADNTYSYLFHSHAGKAALRALLRPLAGEFALDVGQGWGDELPGWVALSCALTAAIAAISTSGAVPNSGPRRAGSNSLPGLDLDRARQSESRGL